jgi:hypothetical protein
MLRKCAALGLPLYLRAACSNDNLNAPLATPSATAASAATDGGFSYAVIGDRPYVANKLAEMPQLIAQINADPAVSMVIHVGDIEAGSRTGCLDTYFSSIKDLFDTFEEPFSTASTRPPSGSRPSERCSFRSPAGRLARTRGTWPRVARGGMVEPPPRDRDFRRRPPAAATCRRSSARQKGSAPVAGLGGESRLYHYEQSAWYPRTRST